MTKKQSKNEGVTFGIKCFLQSPSCIDTKEYGFNSYLEWKARHIKQEVDKKME